jgi:putative peptidoglycan lipid II flippase
MGMLNSLGHFFVPALSPAMFNLASIIVAIVFIPFAGTLGVAPITIVAVGTLIGGIAQVAIQWPLLRREGFRYRPVLDVGDEGLRQVLFLMGPGTIGMAATQINVFVNTMLATREGTGAVSWLDFAFRIMYLPIGLFGVSIATAATPAISRLAAESDFGRIRSTLAHAISLMLLLNLPATLGLIVLARPIVAVIFQRGLFTAADTEATASALQFYAIGLVGYSIVRIVSPTFYALRRSRLPVFASVGSVLVNIGLNVWLVGVLGFRGLALGTSVTALLNATAQLFMLRREIHGIEGPRLLSSFLRVATASVLMAVATWAVAEALTSWLPGNGFAPQVTRLLLSIGTGLLTLAAAAHVLRIPEFDEARGMMWSRMKRITG